MMTHADLREQVRRAHLDLIEHGLMELTWGNVSAADPDAGIMVIKPSGVSPEALSPDDVVVVSMESGDVVEGRLRPSSDTPTHRCLYQAFEGIGAVVHTHSRHAVCWAQAEQPIDCLGTTHADHFHGPVPVTRRLRAHEIERDYEWNTGRVIVECFRKGGLDPLEVPGALVARHGPFTWGCTVREAVENAVVLELAAGMAFLTCQLDPGVGPIDQALLDKHFLRKHGAGAYYGQE